jgi:hypothetical protein
VDEEIKETNERLQECIVFLEGIFKGPWKKVGDPSSMPSVKAMSYSANSTPSSR